MIAIPPRWEKPLRRAGYGAALGLTLLISFCSGVSRDRVKDKLEAALSADPMATPGGAPLAIGMNVTLGEVHLPWFGIGVSAKDIVLRTRPMDPTAKPARYVIDDAKVKIGLFGLLFRRPSYRFSGHLGNGEAQGKISLSSKESSYDISADSVSLASFAALQTQLGLPIAGVVTFKTHLTLAEMLAAKSNGTIDIKIEDLIVGDGKAQFKVPTDPFLAQGVTFPRLRLGTLEGHISFDKGRGKLENFHLKSPDGEVFIEGTIELRDPLMISDLRIYLRFKPAETLIKREPTVELLTNALGSIAKRPDGFYGIQISGPLASPFTMPTSVAPTGFTNPPPSPGLAPSNLGTLAPPGAQPYPSNNFPSPSFQTPRAPGPVPFTPTPPTTPPPSIPPPGPSQHNYPPNTDSPPAPAGGSSDEKPSVAPVAPPPAAPVVPPPPSSDIPSLSPNPPASADKNES